jgi:hypothetical protein
VKTGLLSALLLGILPLTAHGGNADSGRKPASKGKAPELVSKRVPPAKVFPKRTVTTKKEPAAQKKVLTAPIPHRKQTAAKPAAAKAAASTSLPRTQKKPVLTSGGKNFPAKAISTRERPPVIEHNPDEHIDISYPPRAGSPRPAAREKSPAKPAPSPRRKAPAPVEEIPGLIPEPETALAATSRGRR